MDEKLQTLISHAYHKSTAFQRRMDAAGLTPEDIRGVADLNRIPILSKDEVVAIQQAAPPFGGMLGVPLSEVRRIFFSPGPTYEPDAGDITPLLDVGAEALRLAGFSSEDVVLNALSYHLVPAGLAVDWALAHMGATILPTGVGNRELQLKMMLDTGVTGYVGTPSFLMSLIQKAEEQGLSFRDHFKLNKALVTAEPLPAALRSTLENEYGIAVTNAYGTAEFGFLALSTSGTAGMAMTFLSEPLVQLVDPETGESVGAGEVGEVVVTNFNSAYPLIRYGTGDMGVNVDPDPGNTVQTERGVILVGRRGEAVKVRGMFVHPNQLRFAVGQVAASMGASLGPVQGVVTRPETADHLEIKIGFDGDPPENLSTVLEQAIQQACRVRVNKIEFVPTAAIEEDALGMIDQREWT